METEADRSESERGSRGTDKIRGRMLRLGTLRQGLSTILSSLPEGAEVTESDDKKYLDAEPNWMMKRRRRFPSNDFVPKTPAPSEKA